MTTKNGLSRLALPLPLLAGLAFALGFVAGPGGSGGGGVARADDGLVRTIEKLEREFPEHVSAGRIGTSGEGAPIPVIRLGRSAGGAEPDERPALLVVAGIDGVHGARIGTPVAAGLARTLVADHAELLDAVTVYVVPRVNPDGAARGISGVLVPEDDDRDGRVDEDGPDDLNGDGRITWMRIPNPPPGIERTHAPDEGDPRLLREADPAGGVPATHAILREGRDDDGDGRYGEDGPGEVSLDRNFPHQWPEVGPGIGRYPMSRPETRALADWMLERPNLAAVLVLGPHDTIVNLPEAGKYDATRRAPLGLEKDDAPWHRALRERFVEITGMKSAPKHGADEAAGSFHGWAYAQYGVPTFSTPAWVRPDRVEQREEDAEDSKDDADGGRSEAARGGRGGGGRGGSGGAGGGGAKELADERAWLAYSDGKRRGDLFVEWTTFEHPELGAVEIGGFVPGYRFDALESEIPRLVGEQAAFAAAIAERLPRVSIADPTVERAAPGLYRVRVELANEGFLPTTSAIGAKVRRLTPFVVRPEVPTERIVAGPPLERFWTIDGSGGRVAGEWLVLGEEGSEIEITVRASALGERRLGVRLVPTGEGEERGR